MSVAFLNPQVAGHVHRVRTPAATMPLTPAMQPAAAQQQVLHKGRLLLSSISVFACLRTLRSSRTALKRKAVSDDKATSGGTAVATKEEDEAVPFFETVSGDDPLVLELEERLRRMNGNPTLTLEMVLHPGTIINTEREVIMLKAELKATPEEDVERRKELEDEIEKKQMKVVTEMRQVMTDNLKLEFLLQAVLSVFIFGALSYDAWPWLPDLRGLGINSLGTKFVFRMFGLWGIWLLTIPALRARKPGGPYGLRNEEKRALDAAWLVLPFICLLTPFFTKDVTATYWASLTTLIGFYVWSFNTPLVTEVDPNSRGAANDLNLPEPLMWALKALDFGTGAERGARSEDRMWKEQLEEYERAAEELAAKKRAQSAAS
jgi:hypothetical protein